MFDFEESWAVSGDGGSSGKSEYIQNGLVLLEYNGFRDIYNSNRIVTSGTPFTFSLSGVTIELYARVDGIAGTTRYASLFGSYPFVFGISDNSVGTGSDYGIDVWWASDDNYLTADGLVYQDWHTFSFVSDTDSAKLYIDGALADTASAMSYSQSDTYDYGIMRISGRSQRPYITNGYWASARMYNRALSAAEIAQNRAVDLSEFAS